MSFLHRESWRQRGREVKDTLDETPKGLRTVHWEVRGRFQGEKGGFCTCRPAPAAWPQAHLRHGPAPSNNEGLGRGSPCS